LTAGRTAPLPSPWRTPRALLQGFVRRLARSAHAQRFVVRGSLVTAEWCPGARPAADVDLVGTGPWDPDAARVAIREVLRERDDVTSFDAEIASFEVIWADTPFPGLRTKIRGSLAADGATTRELQIDLGYGDPLAVPPVATTIGGDGPVLAVRPETMFGWKAHGLFEFGRGQWRAKDLYDLWLLAERVPMDGSAVVRSVEVAFASRGLPLSAADRFLFDDRWGGSRGSRRRWESFARKSGLGEAVPRIEVAVGVVRARLASVLAALGHTAADAELDADAVRPVGSRDA